MVPEFFERHRGLDQFEYVAGAYMLVLVSCTIFAYKSFTVVEAKYLPLSENLLAYGKYS